ncbi:MarR family winged helix-turn-helix transcriptional regulator [Enemella sp. A6]|uniref:MarR family winged helix-turn-helix transcriptional regulator n=1 Tax=Enemella sp. A6 TaxID=3440152 RepID=UPI003EBFD276
MGLTPVRARALYGLYAQGPQRQHALSAIAGCSPQQMNGILEALEARGYIVRNPDPKDGRATNISLTTDGWTLASVIDTLRQDAAGELFGSFDDDTLVKFTEVVDKLLERISETDMSVSSAQERVRLSRGG